MIRAVLAAVVPLTGDEAYFVLWGGHLDAGYYDHTPMVGWWLSAVLLLGKSVWLVRLPALLTTVAVAVLLWQVARRLDAEKAGWIGAIYLWSPHSVLKFFTTTDTPLLLFSVVAGVFLFQAVRSDRSRDYLLTGVFLGLAFLSKYFAVLLGPAIVVLLLAFAGRPRWLGLALVVLGAVPGIAVNVAWNYHNGWVNILFNLYNRTSDAGFSVGNTLSFLAVVVLPIGPVAWNLVRSKVPGRLGWTDAWAQWRESGVIAFVVAFAVPLGLLFLVSFGKPVGAHWPVSFYPFFFLALIGLFTAEGLRRLVRPMVVFGGALAGLGLVVVMLPVELLRDHRKYPSVVLSVHMDEVLVALEPYRGDYLLATPSYSKSALLTFYGDVYVPVVGPGSYHGRQDDLITDMRALDGRDILVLIDRPSRVARTTEWFDRFEVKIITVRGAEFSIVLGRGFQFAKYRDTVILPMVARFYRVPAWLAAWSPPSPFCERYGLQGVESPATPTSGATPGGDEFTP